MITQERVKELLQLNLRDERMTASVLFIKGLIARKKHGAGIEQYRILNKTTGQWITTVDQFIDQLQADKLFLAYPYEGEKLQGDRVTGFLVTLDNYEIVWNNVARSDDLFSGIFDLGSQKYFQFYLIYMNDGDLDLPLKISYTKLVSQ